MQKNNIILNELKKWFSSGLITKEEFDNISKMYERDYFDFRAIIKWILITGTISIALGVVFLVSVIVHSVYFLIFLFTLLAISGFVFEYVIKKRDLHMPKTVKSIIAVSSIFLAGDIFVVSYVLFPGNDNFSLLILIITTIYFFIAYLKVNAVILIMALISLALWYGTERYYNISYLLSINYPMRFALISPILIVLGFLNKKIFPKKYLIFTKVYYIIGLLYTNVSLWLLSMFGRDNRIIFLNKDHRSELLIYSFIYLIVDVIFFSIGLKYKNRLFTNYAIFFTILNLYTRYFEYFFKEMSAWGFFMVLGLVTVITGVIFERIVSRNGD